MGMIDSKEQAVYAARRKLADLGCVQGGKISNENAGKATAAFIRSLIQDGNWSYLDELTSELPDAAKGKLWSLVAQALDTNESADDAETGAHLRDAATTYLADEIDLAAAYLPLWSELVADDYDEEQARERLTA